MQEGPNGPQITVPPTLDGCIAELSELRAQGQTIQGTVAQLQQRFAEINQRAILLQGAIAAHEAMAPTLAAVPDAEAEDG